MTAVVLDLAYSNKHIHSYAYEQLYLEMEIRCIKDMQAELPFLLLNRVNSHEFHVQSGTHEYTTLNQGAHDLRFFKQGATMLNFVLHFGVPVAV